MRWSRVRGEDGVLENRNAAESKTSLKRRLRSNRAIGGRHRQCWGMETQERGGSRYCRWSTQQKYC